jgi:hypothetical protein
MSGSAKNGAFFAIKIVCDRTPSACTFKTEIRRKIRRRRAHQNTVRDFNNPAYAKCRGAPYFCAFYYTSIFGMGLIAPNGSKT